MFNYSARGLFSSRNRPVKPRRPAGVSRKRKRQLGFETLEDRRVMSAQSPIDTSVLDQLDGDVQSFSSATPEGQLAILQRELERYAQETGVTPTIYVTNSIPSDPLLVDQWHLINSGQQVGNPDFQDIFAVPGEDINVAPVWNLGVTGDGVVVAVIDSGVEFTHIDLADNIDPTFQLDALTGDADASPEPDFLDPNTGVFRIFINAHGTSVGGIIGAESDNDVGGTGIAHGAQLVPIRLIDAGQTEQAFIDAFRFRTDEIDITNNSWGPAVVRGLAGPTPDQTLALRDSIFFGRDGLGIIHVFAAGNSGLQSDSSNYNGWVNSRYTIGVTGVDHDGTYSNVDGTTTGYPETAASVLVAAPTGSVALDIVNDTGLGSGIVTTDTTDDSGFNVLPDPDTGQEFDRDFLDDEAFTSRFNGTSAAAPMVSGVIALMLEVNPNLTWRDVQEILVRSSRQNSEFATQADGADKALGIEYQPTWIMNQVPLFHDPDIWDPLISPDLEFFHPTLDPGLTVGFNVIHYAPTPQVLTNAAGYTVSQGRGTNRENTGFAHGVVDAELAVLLAQQWGTKGQDLPVELTFTTEFNGSLDLPSAEVVNDILGPGTVDMIIPGGFDGEPGFSAYWAEYLVDVPDFSQDFFDRGAPLEFTVPSPNDMVIETIEVTAQITGDMTEFLDNVRVVLVSPNGTHSELNHYFVDPSFNANENVHQAGPGVNQLLNINGFNNVTAASDTDFFDAGSVDTGITTFTFSTNRNWGERSDDAIIFDPTTAEPVIDLFGLGGNRFNAIDPSAGDLLTSGWQLYMENYSPVDLTLANFEVAWHGSPIGANTQRIQGLVGVDNNRDDLFNYSRVTQVLGDVDGDLSTLRLGEVANLIDPTHESMGANVTVTARRASDGIIVDQFVTGADGNYYFDLIPDDYIISVDDPLGRTALDDSLTPAGFLQDYQNEWVISSDFFQVWNYSANLEVPVDGNGVPLPFLDGGGSAVEYHVNHINFLLDPGASPAQQVDLSGFVYADTSGDGIFNPDDIGVPGVGVFGDVNRNGQFDSGEVLATTDADGLYMLTVPNITSDTVINVGILPPTDWVPTNPATGLINFFVGAGDVLTDVDFAIMPPSGVGAGDGSSEPGYLVGVVFADDNADSIRQPTEVGSQNMTVYLDANDSGDLEPGEVTATTNVHGAFIFENVAPGTHRVRIDLDPLSSLEQTLPIANTSLVVTLAGGGTISGLTFGIGNDATLDFGDLPASYGITLDDGIEDGARHPLSLFFLGELIDAESDGQPSIGADGDDLMDKMDEDGIVFGPIVAGSPAFLDATASRHGGYLQAWMDFNGDNDFDDVIDGVSERILTDLRLDAGLNSGIEYAVPATIDATTIYARFRYGEIDIDSVTGLALVGEVEDYAIDHPPAPVPDVIIHGPDFNEDGQVSGLDFLAWQLGAGTSSDATAADGDADSDGDVDGDDLDLLTQDFGVGATSAPVVVETGDFNSDGQVSGFDFLAWQLGLGAAAPVTLADGDGNGDGSVDGSDLTVWEDTLGDSAAAAAAASSSHVQVSTLSASAQTAAATTDAVQLSSARSLGSNSANGAQLAALASEVSLRTQAPRPLTGFGGQLGQAFRFETVQFDTTSFHRLDVDQPLASQHDRALEQLFTAPRGKDSDLVEELADRRTNAGGKGALETVFNEAIDWRL